MKTRSFGLPEGYSLAGISLRSIALCLISRSALWRSALAALMLAPSLALATTNTLVNTYTWIGGTNGDFGTPSNWSPAPGGAGTAPSLSTDGVLFTNSGSTTVTLTNTYQIYGVTFNAGAVTTLTGGTLQLAGNGNQDASAAFIDNAGSTINSAIQLTGGDTIQSATGKTTTINGALNLNGYDCRLDGGGGTLTMNGVISGTLTGGPSLDFNNGGTVNLNALNTFSSASGMSVWSGNVITTQNSLINQAGGWGSNSALISLGYNGGGAGAIYNGAAITNGHNIVVQSGGSATDTIGGTTAAISAYTGTITLGNGTATNYNGINVSAASGGQVNVTGNISRAAGGTGTNDTLTKIGAGIVALSGTNTYQGVTLVNAGTLLINGTNSGPGTFTVNSGGTLGGTGSLAGATTIASGGNLTPGVSGTGLLTISNSLTLSSGSTTTFNITATNNFSSINLGANALTEGGALVFAINGYTPTAGNTFQLVTFGSQSGLSSGVTLTGTQSGTFTDAAGVWSYTNGSTVWQYSYLNGQLSILAVPEPSDIALIALSGLALVIGMRRRARAD